MPDCRHSTRNFQDRWRVVVVELGHINKYFVKNIYFPSGKYFRVFLSVSLKTTFFMENLTQRWTQSEFFSQNQTTVFDFQKRKRRSPLSPLVVCLWVLLKMDYSPWICLNILKNAWINSSDNARALNMHYHLTCSTGFWKCLRF